jgi:hypothetical protein
MEDHGRYKFGDSKSLGDMTLELCAALDKYAGRYMDYLKSNSLIDEEDDETMKMLKDTIRLFKASEMVMITWAEVNERTEHKTDKILKKLDDLECK